MMKRLALVCALVLVVAASASAGSNYLWNAGAYDTVGSSGASTSFGQFTPTGANEFTYPTGASAVCANVVYTGTFGTGMTKTNLYKKQWVTTGPSTWLLEAWAPSAFEGSAITLRLWGTTASTNKPTGTWTVTKVYDPVLNSWARTPLGTINCNTITSAGSTASPWFMTTLTLSKTDAPYTATNGYLIELSIPEPGSMLAMLSGLVGLVGFGIRRRR